MKRVFFLVAFFLFIASMTDYADAQSKKSYKPKTVRVKSYKTRKGRRVRSHKRSKPSRRSRTYVIPMIQSKEQVA